MNLVTLDYFVEIAMMEDITITINPFYHNSAISYQLPELLVSDLNLFSIYVYTNSHQKA
jgi:hypothetical protein